VHTKLIRHRLYRRRRQLLDRYRDELDRADEELASPESEDVERATEQWDARLLSILGDTDARALAEVIAALRRIDDGSYGACTSCGERIGAARLDVLPEAALCIECALARVPSLRHTA
jgi:DnaK suppressor protein